MLKLLAVMLVLAAVFIGEVALFGQGFEIMFSQARCSEWFSGIRPYGWAVGVALLIGDLLLPVPATGIMAALGNVYGFPAGTILGVIGSAGAGFIGYGVARLAGGKASRFLASEEELERFRYFFDRWGGAAIIISRFMPVLPEVMAILAGIARMHPARFAASLLLGTIPSVMLFSWIGQASGRMPHYGVLVAVVVPLLLWPAFLKFVQVKDGRL
ncbi:MAG: VTT domain-containing protein [Deltaproteobacteria bacterium]|nr:VTT domain-containing protein [Deltaproteobacteria bacterium]